MKKAAIVYQSQTGTTRAFADQIASFLGSHGIETRVVSIAESGTETFDDVDYLFLGCWTQGLFVIAQHPDAAWVDFARRLPPVSASRVGLFTTYKIATGGMFRQMRRHLASKTAPIGIELKSRNGLLSPAQRSALERFVA
jgi:flavodoxin